MRSATIALLAPIVLWLGAARTGHAAEPALHTALKTELARAQTKLRLKGYEAPYFLAYAVRELENFEMVGRFGALAGTTQ